MGQAINGIAGPAGGFPVYSGLQGPGGTMPGLVGQIDDQGNLIPGTGGLGNPNGPQVGVGSGGLPPADGSAPGLGGKVGAQYGATQMNIPGTNNPGMGGKGPISQIPIDMNGNVLGDTQSNLPQPPAGVPLGAEQGGTPGRPVPAAPMSPRGVGFANPGAPGAPPKTPTAGGPLTGNFQPNIDPQALQFGRSIGMTIGQPNRQPQRPLTGNFQPRPMGNLSPQPLGKPPVVGQITKPNKGIGTTYGPLQRGAGRGGILR